MRLILVHPQYVADDPQSGNLPLRPGWIVRIGRARPMLSGGCKERMMLFTIAVILLVLWLLGIVSGYTLGNFIYVLLVIALVLFVVGLVSGRRAV
jgi:hypothetical protein